MERLFIGLVLGRKSNFIRSGGKGKSYRGGKEPLALLPFLALLPLPTEITCGSPFEKGILGVPPRSRLQVLSSRGDVEGP